MSDSLDNPSYIYKLANKNVSRGLFCCCLNCHLSHNFGTIQAGLAKKNSWCNLDILYHVLYNVFLPGVPSQIIVPHSAMAEFCFDRILHHFSLPITYYQPTSIPIEIYSIVDTWRNVTGPPRLLCLDSINSIMGPLSTTAAETSTVLRPKLQQREEGGPAVPSWAG
jgi:hypothetical protein